MSDKHTPGPWRLRRGMLDPDGVKLFISGKNWAEFASVYIRIDGREEFDPEGLANARLIAAAPDLLDLVKTLHSQAKLFNRDTDSIWAAIDARFREVIAKVEDGE